MPSLTRQADAQAARSLTRCAYLAGAYTGSPGVVYPYYTDGSTAAQYLYFGKVVKLGERWMFNIQRAGSPFVAQGLMPAFNAPITISGTQQTVDYAGIYTGVVLNKLFEGNFSVTVVTDGDYLLPNMAWREAAFNPVEAYSYRAANITWMSAWAPLSPALTTAGIYWNFGRGASNSSMLYMRYERSGNTLTVKWGDTVDAINNELVSSQCTTGHLVACSFGNAGGGTLVDIVGYTGTPYAYVAPDTLGSVNYPGGTLYGGLAGCTLVVSKSSYVAAKNTAADFTVHLFTGGGPYSKPAFPNCTVMGFSGGTVTFTATSPSAGSRRLVVFVADPTTGITASTIADSADVTVDNSGRDSLPTATIWLDGSDPSSTSGAVVTNDTAITAWYDRISGTKTCTPRASNELVYKTGQFSGSAASLGCIYHDGTQDAPSRTASSAQILNSGITFGAASYSFSMLVKVSNIVDQTDRGYLLCGPVSNILFIGMWLKNFQTWNGGVWADSGVPNANVDIYTGNPWVHVCMTYTTGTRTILGYVNGKAIGTASVATQSTSASQTLFIGGSEQNDYCLRTYIADFRGWASALTAQDVKKLTAVLRNKFELALIEPP